MSAAPLRQHRALPHPAAHPVAHPAAHPSPGHRNPGGTQPGTQPRTQANALPGSQPGASAGPRRHLEAVGAPDRARSFMPFTVLCVAVILVALGAVLLINTTMAEGAYERRDLKREIATLGLEAERLSQTIEANGAPESLAKHAEKLGMAPATALGSVSLSEQMVLENGK